jgi:uncharacterized membrane protein HdeD (DUF308 family)
MRREIVVNWWALALRGLAGIVLGIAAFAWTGLTLAILVLLVAAYLLVDGLFALVAGTRSRSWLLILEGLLGIVAGLLAWRWPGITALVLVFLTAGWAIVTGGFEVAAAIVLRRVIRGEWILLLAGTLSVVFGILLVVNPVAGLVALVWIFGAYALLSGALMLALALRLRSLGGRMVVSERVIVS